MARFRRGRRGAGGLLNPMSYIRPLMSIKGMLIFMVKYIAVRQIIVNAGLATKFPKIFV